MSIRMRTWSGPLAVLFLTALVAGCPEDEDTKTCGDGTELVNGECVPITGDTVTDAGGDAGTVDVPGDPGPADPGGEDTAGEDTAGEDTAGEDTAGEDTAGEDTAGEDTAVQDTAVEDTAGEDTAVQDTAGEDTAGEDTAGEDTAGEDNGALDVEADTVVAPVALPFAVDDHFFPSGYMGDGETVGLVTEQQTCDPRAGDAGGLCHQFSYTGGAQGWAGVYWQYPEDNWGDTVDGLPIEAGATAVTFYAWGAAGGEVVKFQVGIQAADGFEVATADLTLTTTPTQYTLSLGAVSYDKVVGGFAWFSNAASGVTVGFTVDDITWTNEAVAVAGCMDAAAANYDATATSDDGSCTYDVTFNVDMSCSGVTPTVVSISGPLCSWCGSGDYDLTDADADGVWTGTWAFAPGAIEYKYMVDNFAGQENLIGDGACAPVTDGSTYANRQVTVTDAPIVLDETYGLCVACGADVPGCMDAAATNYNATATSDDGSCTYATTFQVDLSGETLGASAVVYVNASFNGWCDTCNPMTDQGSGIWAVTLPLPAGAIEYKYTIDGWSGTIEGVPLACDVTGGANQNRGYTVPAAASTVTLHPFGACWYPGEGGCMDPAANNYDAAVIYDDGSCEYDVTFQVDLSAETIPAGGAVYVHATFNGWCDLCNPLTDAGGGVWSVTLPITGGDIQYKYTINGWSGTVEDVPMACGVWSDPAYNRTATITAVATLPLHAFGQCAP